MLHGKEWTLQRRLELCTRVSWYSPNVSFTIPKASTLASKKYAKWMVKMEADAVMECWPEIKEFPLKMELEGSDSSPPWQSSYMEYSASQSIVATPKFYTAYALLRDIYCIGQWTMILWFFVELKLLHNRSFQTSTSTSASKTQWKAYCCTSIEERQASDHPNKLASLAIISHQQGGRAQL